MQCSQVNRCLLFIMQLLFLLVLNFRQGLGKHGNEYGPLQEIPDWSYAGQYFASVCITLHK